MSSLADHPHRLELVGRLATIDWPSLCAHCATPTDDRLTVRKAFLRPRSHLRHRRGRLRHVIATARIPYCASCAARHRALVPTRSALADLWRMLWPVLIPMAGSGFFFLLTLKMAVAEQMRGDLAFRYVWGLPALFGAIVVWCVVIAWHSSRALRLERQTEVTRACDFSDDVSWFWERERRIYAMSNAAFAQAVADANQGRVWRDDDARRSRRQLVAGVAAMCVVGAFVWILVVWAPL